jgi:hypothetical protein
MKVELLINLKIASGKILSVGTIFDDNDGPIPEFIMKRVRRGSAKIIDARPSSKESAVIAKPIKAAVTEENLEQKELFDGPDTSSQKDMPEVVSKVIKKNKLTKKI